MLVILDPSLIGAVPLTEGLKPNGKIIINSQKDPSEFVFEDAVNPTVYTADCTSIAVEYGLGSAEAPIVNTAILGAVAKATGLVSIDNVVDAIIEKIPVKKEINAEAARESYNKLQG